MKRRQFMISTVGAVAANLLVTQHLSHGETTPEMSARTYRILGVPLRAGSLLPGSEDDAQAYRELQLLERLQAAGCNAVDDGDVPIPNYLPHHSIPPIRSWPAPRIAWECIRDRVAPLLQQPNQIPLLIGCDCSVVLGTTEALKRASAQDVHVIYVDGDFDDAAPEPGRCQSAASCAVWLLTHDSPFWAGPPLQPSQVSVVGWTNPSRSKQSGMNSISLTEVRRSGPRESARRVLEAIPASSALLLHIDIDVLRKKDLHAAYFPHTEGLSLSEAAELLGVLLKDPRIRIIEISEYASLRDTDREYVKTLVNLLAEGMKK
jgi:arginase family enzyme